MKPIVRVALALMTVQAATGAASDAPTGSTRRFALIVGANRGAAGRMPLRYAVTDAERFADVVTQMGGVQPGDRTILHDPTRQALVDALVRTGEQAGAAKGDHERVEVLVYFSGHADDRGLMLGREVMPYRELRDAVASMRADVGITILDACASGAITRLKGGRTHPAFLTGTPSEVKGYAFLTSSSENETAQESDRLRGSFFTHALVSGLRGAADVSGDGKVTLNEAYLFAFHETLVQTTTADGGAQHPSYDIKMAGTGEMVITDVRQTSSALVLGEDYDGRFFVLTGRRQLMAELYKPLGRRIELGLDAGEYEVLFEQDKKRLVAKVTIAEGERKELLRGELREAPSQTTSRRGGAVTEGLGRDFLDGSLRAQVGATFLGRWRGSRFTFLNWTRPTLAFELGFGTSTFGADTDVLLGARYYLPVAGRFRPYLGAAVGRLEVFEPQGYTHGIVGGELKAGLDVFLGNRFSIHTTGRGTFAGDRWKWTPELGLGWGFGGRRRLD